MTTNKKDAKLKKPTEDEIRKLIVDPLLRIDLQTLVYKETEELYKLIQNWDTQSSDDIRDIAIKRIEKAESATKDLRKIFYYIAHFGTSDQVNLIRRSLNRLADVPGKNGSVFLIELQLYPAMLLMYASGIASLASENYGNLGVLFDSYAVVTGERRRPLVSVAHANMLDRGDSNVILGTERLHTPLSDRLNSLFKTDIPEEVLYGNDFDALFDTWEITIALQVAHINRDSQMGSWAPIGRFGWRAQRSQDSPIKLIEAEVIRDDVVWMPIKVGLFGGSIESTRDALKVVKDLTDGRYW